MGGGFVMPGKGDGCMLPVYINGERVGELTAAPQGRFWRVRLRMEDIGRVARLSVYGGGRSAYLGIPEPDGRGAMTLERTVRTWPEGAEYCAEREAEPEPEKPPERAEVRPEKPPRHVVWMGGRAYYF